MVRELQEAGEGDRGQQPPAVITLAALNDPYIKMDDASF